MGAVRANQGDILPGYETATETESDTKMLSRDGARMGEIVISTIYTPEQIANITLPFYPR